jgi:hypothetical protein
MNKENDIKSGSTIRRHLFINRWLSLSVIDHPRRRKEAVIVLKVEVMADLLTRDALINGLLFVVCLALVGLWTYFASTS